MKTFKITSLYKVIYIGVIITLFYTYFNSKEVNSYDLDGLKIVETSSLEYPLIPKRIKSLELSYKGLNFNLSTKRPLTVISDDNIKRNSYISSFNIIENSLEINLINDVTLNIKVDNRGQRLSIGSSIPKVFPTIKEVIIPFSLGTKYKLEESDLSYKIFDNQNEFHLKLNDKYYIDKQKQNIHLIATNDKITTLTFSPLSNSALPLAEQWYNQNKTKFVDDINSNIELFLIKAETYISSIFNPITYSTDTNSWRNLPRESLFTEESIIVYLAQGMLEGKYLSHFNRITPLKSRYPNLFTYKSTPFLGNIVENGNLGLVGEERELGRITKQILTSDPNILETWIPKHYFVGNQINTDRLSKLIIDSNIESLTIEQLAVALYNLNNILESDSANSKNVDSVKKITDIILQNIVWDGSGTYIISNNNISDQSLNLKIGQLLLESSQYETSEYTKPLGEALIDTYLNNSNNKGEVSKEYNFKEKLYSTAIISPQESYLALSNNPYIPHYIQDNGIKIWTISNSIDINKTDKSIRITVSFPIDNSSNINSHFLAISGVKPYKQLYFRGRLWRADKLFEKYGVGYYYEYSTNLLYFMPNHTKEREEIVISY